MEVLFVKVIVEDAENLVDKNLEIIQRFG